MSGTERVEKNVDYLKILCKCKSNMRKVIITNADKDLINTICECVYNCLNGNIELNKLLLLWMWLMLVKSKVQKSLLKYPLPYFHYRHK
jgi:hypothetical protein